MLLLVLDSEFLLQLIVLIDEFLQFCFLNGKLLLDNSHFLFCCRQGFSLWRYFFVDLVELHDRKDPLADALCSLGRFPNLLRNEVLVFEVRLDLLNDLSVDVLLRVVLKRFNQFLVVGYGLL